jgi:hypothetical protein
MIGAMVIKIVLVTLYVGFVAAFCVALCRCAAVGDALDSRGNV